MKKETTKKVLKNKADQKEEDRWIDVHNDDVMREMGFNRPALQAPRDKSVWSKTAYEKRILRNVRHSHRKEDMHFHSIPAKRATVRAKLIIQLKPNKVFPKSTYSFLCWDTNVEDMLNKFRLANHKTGQTESVVAKYSYNGISYGPEERPYRG